MINQQTDAKVAGALLEERVLLLAHFLGLFAAEAGRCWRDLFLFDDLLGRHFED